MKPRIPAWHHAVNVLAVLPPALLPVIGTAQAARPAQPAGLQIDRPQLRIPAASEQVAHVLAFDLRAALALTCAYGTRHRREPR